MDQLINPFLLFLGLALGGVGVAMALPRRRISPQVLGAVVGGAGLGVVLLGLGLRHPEQIPNFNFYIFGLIAAGSALRVITHPRPVYSALFFILTILSSCGLYLILSAEFMAFALVIVYAGAILITYLFVIMLATQAPSEEEMDLLADYDVESRSPVAATVAGFVLLAALTTMLMAGSGTMEHPARPAPDALLASMPNKVAEERVLTALRRADLLETDERLISVNADRSTVTLAGSEGEREAPLPAELRVTNVEAVGFDLLNEHPGSIEIAGVILLMAMLGATVLSRKQIEFEEEAKLRQSQALAAAGSVFADKEVRP
ncbi:MAG TPA: NADH-quinone oxidoreductase subunit J [Phycisphaerales bacterium]|nr:NADH-quinone oxidoreductase subunit J [Phycisphaerales bacterium]